MAETYNEELVPNQIPTYKWDELFVLGQTNSVETSPAQPKELIDDKVTQSGWDTMKKNIETQAATLKQYGIAISPIGTDIQSPGFKSGVSGWQLKSSGDFEGNEGTFRGLMEAGSIYIPSVASPVAKIESNGKATFTDIVATGTINAQGGYLASGVYVGTSSSVIECENTGLNVGTSGHIRGGQTDYNTGTGFYLGYSSGAYKISIGNPSGQSLTYDGTNLRINGQGVTVVRIYDSTDTWTKPTGITMVDVVCIGSGGGGGGGAKATAGGGQIAGGGGGGGGAVSRGTIKAADLASTVTVTVATGGTGGSGATSTGAGSPGNNGGTSSFGTHLKAGGGGYGGGGNNQNCNGGAGGGIITNASSTVPGIPSITGADGIGGQAVEMTYCTEYGGAGGGKMVSLGSTSPGSSIFGGPGGGHGAYSNYGGASTGCPGGTTMDYSRGGGAAGGTDGNDGTDGSFKGPYCGTGAGGGGGGGRKGGKGGIGAGGGGGSGANSPTNGGDGGAGGDGRVIVIEYY